MKGPERGGRLPVNGSSDTRGGNDGRTIDYG